MADNPFEKYRAPDVGADNPFAKYAAAEPVAAPKPKLTRSWGEAVTDTAKSVGAGFGSLLQAGGDLYGLASGDFDNFASREGRGMRQFYQDSQSAAMQERRADRSAAIDEADGILGKAGVAIRETLTDPALATDVVASNIPSLIPAAGVGRAAGALRGGRALLQGATQQAAGRAAARAGTAAAIGTGAVQQGADVAGGVYDAAIAKDGAAWAENPDYQQRVAAGEDPEAVKQDLALAAARTAFPAAAAISAVSQAIPGGATLERALVGGAARATLRNPGLAGRAAGVARGALGEGAQEAIEEGGGQFAGNVATRAFVDPNQDLEQDVGENAGMGFAGALGLGGVAGGVQTPRPAREPAKPGSLTEAADTIAATTSNGPVLALPPPTMLGRSDGRVATESQAFAANQRRQERKVALSSEREGLGLTPDVNAARARHPGAVPNERSTATPAAASPAPAAAAPTLQGPRLDDGGFRRQLAEQAAQGAVPAPGSLTEAAGSTPPPPNMDELDAQAHAWQNEQWDQMDDEGVANVVRSFFGKNITSVTPEQAARMTHLPIEKIQRVWDRIQQPAQAEPERDPRRALGGVEHPPGGDGLLAIDDQGSASPPSNLDPDTGELLDIDAAAWPNATEHQQPAAIIDALLATARNGRGRRMPGVTAIGETYNVDKPTARALRNRALQIFTQESLPPPAEPEAAPADADALEQDREELDAVMGSAAPTAEEVYDESDELLDTDIGAGSGGPFTIEDAAQRVAERTEGGKVVPVEGGFVVRTPSTSRQAQVESSAPEPTTAAPDLTASPRTLDPSAPPQSTPATDVARKRAPLNVRMGGQEYPVASIEDASARFLELRDTVGDIGGMRAVELVDESGNEVGYIGHNGEVYEGSRLAAQAGATPVYDPKTPRRYGADEIEGEAAPAADQSKAGQQQAALPATAAAEPSVQAKTRVRKGKRSYVESAPETLAAYFQPGRIVQSYGGQDRVVSFTPAKDGQPWSVRVIAVEKDGSPKSGEVERQHSTLPEQRELVKVLGQPQKPEPKRKSKAKARPAGEASTPAPAVVETLGAIAEGSPAESAIRDLSDEDARAAAKAMGFSFSKTAKAPNIANNLAKKSQVDVRDAAARAYGQHATPEQQEARKAARPSRQQAANDKIRAREQEAEFRRRARGDMLLRENGEPFKTQGAAAAFLGTLPAEGEFAADGFGVYKTEGGFALRRWPTTGTGAIDSGFVDKDAARAKHAAARAAFAAERGLVEDKFGNLVKQEEADRVAAAFDDDGNPRPGFDEGGNPVQDAASLEAAANAAATSPKNDLLAPTDAQKEAGNYKVGRARIAGLDISIENPRGSRRRPEWPPLAHHYGYIRGTIGKDKDHVDVFLTDNAADPDRPVFVVDQVNRDGGFDEHKVVLGAADEAEARKAYLDNYSKGWTGLGAITQMTMADFKAWVMDPAKTKRPAGKIGDLIKSANPPKRGSSKAPTSSDATSDRIEDFGETLHGARKHYAAAYGQRMRDAETLDIAKHPLSKTWPEPDYAKLLEDGADPRAVAFARAARDEVPNKPTKSWKLKRYAETVTALRDTANRLLAGEISADRLSALLGTSRTAGDVMSRMELYQAVGHEKSLKGISIGVGQYSIYNAQRFDPPKTIWTVQGKAKATAMSNWPRILGEGDTKEEAIAAFKKNLAKVGESNKRGPTRFDIYSRRGHKGFFIGKKLGRDYYDLEHFHDAAAARAYLAEHRDELEAKLAKVKDIPAHRRERNSPRVGIDHRAGADVSPEQFSEAFGFRGVQFGNYVEGPRRQRDLNQAYDALMDLAGVLGVPARALSLNGSLGLAFGARGQGGRRAAAAHFEPDTIVINLTKGAGAGSLAHEWWHSLDNYFSRMRGRPTEYVTSAPNSRGEGVRPEMLRAFTRVMNTIHESGLKSRSQALDRRRSKGYWSTDLEMSARAFENYVIAKLADEGLSNDYLANIVSHASFGLPEEYPYLTPEEVPAVRAAYDDFFSTVEREDTPEGNVRLFSKAAGVGGPGLSFDRALKLKAQITGKWGENAPQVVLVEDAEGFPESAKVDPDYRRGEGFFDGKPTIWINVGNIHTEQRFAEVMAHEGLGHFGVESVVGEKEWAGIVDAVERLEGKGAANRRVAAVLQEVRQRYGDVDRETFAKEVIAVLAERGVRNSWVDKVVAAVRRWLRANVPGMKWSETDVLDLLSQAESFLRAGPSQAESRQHVAALAFSRATRSAFSDAGSFAAAVKALSAGTLAGTDPIQVTEGTPDVYRKLGAEDLPITINRNKIEEILRDHPEMSEAILQQLVRHLHEPVAVFDSTSHPGALVALTSAISDGKPVIAALHLNVRNGRALVNRVASVYGREKQEQIGRWIENGKLRYLDQTKIPAWLTTRGLRLPKVGPARTGTSGRRVLTEADVVKPFSSGVGSYSMAPARMTVDADGQRRLELGGETFLDRSGKFYLVNGTGQPRDFLTLGAATEAAKRSGAEIEVNPPMEGEPPSWSVVAPELAVRGAVLPGNRSPAQGLFSKAPEAVLDDIDAVMSADADATLLDRVRAALAAAVPKKLKDQFRPTWLGALATRHLTELGADYFQNMRHYSDFLAEQEADRNKLQAEAEEKAERARKWAGKNRAEAQVLFDLMHDTTIEGVDPSEEYQPLQFRYGGQLHEVTPKKIKEALKALREQMLGRSGDNKTDMMNEAKMLRGMPARERRRREKYAPLVARWNRLSPEAQAIYVDFRDTYEDRSKQVEEGLVARIEDTDAPSNHKRRLINSIRQQFETHRLQGVYFPLQRHGRFFVAAEKADTPTFLMFESLNQMERAVKDLKSRGFTIKAQGLKSEGKAQDAPSGTFVAEIIQSLRKAGVSDKTQDEIYQIYLESLPELSMRKHAIHRQAVPGFDPDAVRAFAFSMHHGAHQLARLRYGHKLQNVLDLLQKQQDDARREAGADTRKIVAGDAIIAELRRRHDWINNPQDSQLTNLTSSLGFGYYLGATPAAALVNLSQTALVSFPYLASRFGGVKAMNHLLSGMRDAIRTAGNIQKTLTDPDERRAYQVLQDMGAIDKSLAHNLAGIAEGGLSGYNPAWAKAMEVIGWGFHKTEVVNREATGMAAYRLARKAGRGFDAAVRLAAEAIWDTHFDYANANRARYMQSGTAKVLLMFRQYSLNMTWHLGRMVWQATKGADPEVRALARRNLAGVLGMSALFSGTMGLPMMGVAMGVLNAIAASFGDDDEPWEAETEFRAFLNDMVGQTAADILLSGLANEVTGADVASRVGLSDLWIREANRELDGRDAYYHLLEQAAGPMGGVLKNVLVGKQLVDEGHTWRGVETMLPKSLKDIMKGARYATEGVNNLRGDPLLDDPSVYQALLQVNGFTPAQVARRYDVNRSLKNYEQAILNRRQRLMDAFAMAHRLGDADAMTATKKRIAAFNRKNPEIAITGKSMVASLRSRARYSAKAEGGIVLNRKIAGRVRESVGED